MSAAPSALTIAQAAQIMRDLVRDKSYQLLPLGQEAAAYLRVKRKRLTESSHRDYERGLHHFARYFPDLRVEDFEPPIGTRRIEEFLDHQYGDGSPRNYNKNLSILRDFFKWQVVSQKTLHGDPTLPIERAKARQVYRTTFPADTIRAIHAAQDDLRDRIAMRLLLDYGLRKGTLRVIQVKHFDHQRRRLTTFAKGGKVRALPIPSKPFWNDLELLLVQEQLKPGDFLMARQRTIPRVGVRRFYDKPMSDHGLHSWWYRCLAKAGVVPEGVESGEHMHKARHTAGQRVLDATGNLKAVQKLLDHSSIQTTGDIYADWDIDQLAQTMADVLGDEE